MSIMAVLDKKTNDDFEGIASVPATELRKDAPGILGRVEFGGEEIILTRHGKPAAALVSLSVLKAIRDMENARDVAAAAAARRDVAKHGSIPWTEVKRRNRL